MDVIGFNERMLFYSLLSRLIENHFVRPLTFAKAAAEHLWLNNRLVSNFKYSWPNTPSSSAYTYQVYN